MARFDDRTYENILDEVLDEAPEDVDTREGSIYYDSVSGICLKIAELYADLALVADMMAVMTATGEALDARASEYGITRLAATSAKYHVTFVGTFPDIGERFYTDGVYFVLGYDDDAGVYYLEAEEPGEAGNNVYAGENAVPVNTIEGLESATFGLIYENGTDDEADDDLRERVEEKIAGPAENGNKQHYKTWCESIDGIGKARIFPLWNGPNTVKAILIDATGQPCSDSKVAEVQEYVDPAEKGMTVIVDGRTYVVGDGLGEGVANMGSHFTAAAAIALTVDVSFSAELPTGGTIDEAQEDAKEAIEQYFESLVLDTDEAADIVIRVSAIGAMLSGLESILDYSDLKINGGSVNIRPGADYVPIIGEVVIT